MRVRPGFSAGSAGSAGSAPNVLFESHHAPPATTRFRLTPTHVVARKPSVGTRKNPAPIAPTAAPAVLAAYSTAAGFPLRADDAEPANQAAAIGKVAPIAAAGTPTRNRLIATR